MPSRNLIDILKNHYADEPLLKKSFDKLTSRPLSMTSAPNSKNIKTLADTCTGGYMKVGIYRHRTIGYWNSDWESLQDQTVYLDSILIRKPKKEEKFKK